MSQHPEVLIVGGGVIGLTTAYFLAKEGMTVEVLDKGDLGTEASWAGAGIIPPGNPDGAISAYDRLRAVSSSMYSEFSQELRSLTGIDNGYRVCGGIEFLDENDRETVPAWKTERIEFEPLAQSAYLLPGMAQVRNPWHLRALIDACKKQGVRLSPGMPIATFERRDSTISGIRLSNGERRSANQYLLAAGAWCENLLEPFGLSTGIHPVRGQIVLLKTERPQFHRIMLAGKNYLVPREDGHVLIGATEEPEACFEKENTPDAIAALIAFGNSLVPELARAEMVKCWAGLRPGSRDGLPSIGRVGNFDNFFLASGHFRAGIQLSPGTGLVVSDLLMSRTSKIPLDDFLPGREPGKLFRSAFRS